MLPELDLGPLTLQTFGLCFALSFVVAGAVAARGLAELGKPTDWAYEMVFAALVGGLIGARLDYLIQNWDAVSGDLAGSIFSTSGLVFFGGLAGGAIGVLVWARWRGFATLALADLVAPALALAYAVGRVGCQLSGDGDYGTATDLPWGMAYPEGTVPTEEVVHPTPIYETLAMGTAALVLWRLRGRLPQGALFSLYLVIVGVERLLIELLRRNDAVVVGLTEAQVIGVVLALAGSVGLVRALRGPEPPRTA